MFKFFDQITKPSQKIIEGAARQIVGQAQQSFTDATQRAADQAAREIARAIESGASSAVSSFLTTDASGGPPAGS